MRKSQVILNPQSLLLTVGNLWLTQDIWIDKIKFKEAIGNNI